MVKVNHKLLPVKAHFFFFMACKLRRKDQAYCTTTVHVYSSEWGPSVVSAMGPILPFTIVFGKQLGISEIVMGTISAVLPLLFLVAKPAFGYLADYFQVRRPSGSKRVGCVLKTKITFLFITEAAKVTIHDFDLRHVWLTHFIVLCPRRRSPSLFHPGCHLP